MEPITRIYIAGPMTGYKEYNFPAFDAAKEHLIDNPLYELEVISPADITRELSREMGITDYSLIPMKKYLYEDINALFECDAIYMLKGWENSKGARAEHALAVALDIEIFYQS